ncbi:Ras-related GTP-binding protein C [Armadillidium vulgare]|nr:Ras-related GTP-binding protein C [Armadillidium vulgare]
MLHLRTTVKNLFQTSYPQDDDEAYQGDYGAGYVGSFSKDFVYGPDDPEADVNMLFPNDQKPKILLMGLRRSGKSSIQNVVFHKMSPNETLFLESTNKIVTDDISNTSFVQFKILDFPGQIDFFEPSFDSEKIFGGQGALVFDDYMDALNRLHETVIRAYKVNPKLKFEVFIHKVDGLPDDSRIDTQRDINKRVTDELNDSEKEVWPYASGTLTNTLVKHIVGLRDGEAEHLAAFDKDSASIIKLNNSTVLYLRQVSRFLALVCIINEDNFQRPGLINYNFLCFREAIIEVFEIANQKNDGILALVSNPEEEQERETQRDQNNLKLQLSMSPDLVKVLVLS